MPGSECCEHCAEIPRLREEVAALRARLNALTTLPLSASDLLPLQAEPHIAAKTPPRQMPLFGPVHGPPLPRVDHESSLQAKVGLYRTLFAGRSDVYAYRWENTAEGTKGWAPKRRPGTTRDNPEYLPLTDEVISAHLTKENPAACGLYVTLPDSTCRLLVTSTAAPGGSTPLRTRKRLPGRACPPLSRFRDRATAHTCGLSSRSR